MQSNNQDQQQFRATAQDLNTRWDAAFNAKQAAQLASFYDAEASVTPTGAAPANGTKEIEEFWTSMIAQGVMEHRIEMTETVVDANLALQRGKWSAAAIDGYGDRQTFGGGLQLAYRRQADGSWKILSHIWNM